MADEPTTPSIPATQQDVISVAIGSLGALGELIDPNTPVRNEGIRRAVAGQMLCHLQYVSSQDPEFSVQAEQACAWINEFWPNIGWPGCQQ